MKPPDCGLCDFQRIMAIHISYVCDIQNRKQEGDDKEDDKDYEGNDDKDDAEDNEDDVKDDEKDDDDGDKVD